MTLVEKEQGLVLEDPVTQQLAKVRDAFASGEILWIRGQSWIESSDGRTNACLGGALINYVNDTIERDLTQSAINAYGVVHNYIKEEEDIKSIENYNDGFCNSVHEVIMLLDDIIASRTME